MQTAWQKKLAQEIRIHRSCTSGHTRPWCILTPTSCTRDPHTPILHKCSYRILLRRSWHKHLGQEIRIQRSFTSGPTGSWCKPPGRDFAQEIRIQRSWTSGHTRARSWCKGRYAQEARIQRSCTSGPTGSCWGDLAHRHLAQEILIQWSCTSGPRGSWYRDPDTDILHKRSSYSDLAQVALEAADAEILTQTWHPLFPTKKTPKHGVGSLAGIIA